MIKVQDVVTAYAASTPRFLGKFPDNDIDELWEADIKAFIPAGESRIFKNIMFVESQGAIYIFGIEHEDGSPREVRPELAVSQKAFIDFLRQQNRIKEQALGGLTVFFQGSEYASQARATAAYMIHRGHLTDLAVGYLNRKGEYICEKFENESAFRGSALATLPFDELC